MAGHSKQTTPVTGDLPSTCTMFTKTLFFVFLFTIFVKFASTESIPQLRGAAYVVRIKTFFSFHNSFNNTFSEQLQSGCPFSFSRWQQVFRLFSRYPQWNCQKLHTFFFLPPLPTGKLESTSEWRRRGRLLWCKEQSINQSTSFDFKNFTISILESRFCPR